MKKQRKREIGPQWLRWLLFSLGALAIGLGTAVAVQWVVKGELSLVWPWVARYPAHLLLSALLYGAVAYTLAAACNSLALSAVVVGGFGLVLGLVDYFNTAINGTPLNFADLKLAGQLGDVAGVAGDLVPPQAFVNALCVLAGVAVALVLLRKVTRLSGRWRFLSLSLPLVMTLGLFSDSGARDVAELFSVQVNTRVDITKAHDTFGLTLSLWRDCFFQQVPAPAGYSADYMQQVLERTDALLGEPVTAAETPNVIFVLSESFFDVNRLPGLTFERDPLENFHALAKEGVSGSFFTSYLGYGTGYNELSMLQGVNGLDFGAGTNLSFLPEEQYDLLPSLVTPFKDRGYRAEMLHAFDNSLYNRVVTYPKLGFDQLYFSDDVQQLGFDWTGGMYGGYYLQDKYLLTGVLDRMRTINEGGQKAFLFAITMENHQPFDADKFDRQCQIGLTCDALGDDDLAIAKVMLEGITRADQSLGFLAEQLRATEEPTIVVFFGDHRPNLFLTDGETIYTKLGLCPENDALTWTPEEMGDLYSTDYLIWANDPALLRGQAGTRADSSISAIGPKLLELTGAGESRYWGLLEQLSQASLLDIDSYFVDGQGRAYANETEAGLSQEERELLELKKAVTYDAFYGKQYITAAMNQAPGTPV